MKIMRLQQGAVMVGFHRFEKLYGAGWVAGGVQNPTCFGFSKGDL